MSASDWRSFWREYRLVDIESDDDLLYQVGKTVGGDVISREQFQILVGEVVGQMKLSKTDNLLDLCCGNGVLTKALASYVNKVVGMDFSEPYIQNAQAYCKAPNAEYILHDVNDLRGLKDKLRSEEINKILIYDALAYFDKKQLDELVGSLREILPGPILILFASVLDRKKIWSFFNTWGRKYSYLVNIKLRGKSQGLGTWWRSGTFGRIAETHGLQCRIFSQDPVLHTSHYRMNVVLSS